MIKISWFTDYNVKPYEFQILVKFLFKTHFLKPGEKFIGIIALYLGSDESYYIYDCVIISVNAFSVQWCSSTATSIGTMNHSSSFRMNTK